MAITYTSRTGKTWHLHTGPKRGGGVQYFFATKLGDSIARSLPDGFEIYESVNGQVFLRRIEPRLIRVEETTCIDRQLERRRGGKLYKTETRGRTLTIFESQDNLAGLGKIFPQVGPQKKAVLRERFASYQPVMRLILADEEQRLFAPERYCFRGSVDDWISVGAPEPIKKLAVKYLKHLGQDSFFELF